MPDQLDVIQYFDFVQTRSSKNYLINFFNRTEHNIKEVFYTQGILKMFQENLDVINSFRVMEGSLLCIKTFLDEVDPTKFNNFNKLFYRQYINEVNFNIDVYVNFFEYFGDVLKSIRYLNICPEYAEILRENIRFISSLNISDLQNGSSGNKKRKIILNNIEWNIKNNKYSKFWDFFYMFDVYVSISKGIAKNKLVFPSFNFEDQFIIEDLKNLKLENSVKNSLKITGKNTIIFTGANMSGKSTAMRSISTIVYLSHLGLAVPASYCNIPFYDKIFLFFTVSDNIEMGYSYFAQELLNLKNVLISLKDKTSFVVFDEIFKGTNINDSSRITLKTIKALSKYNTSLFILSTHLNGIEQLITDSEKIVILNLESFFKDNALTFTYKIKKGWSKLEIGEILFEKYGLNDLL
ncbi:hypothetical protein I6H88_09660 [Elizabethkingia bruuniana]|uniref:DNA mismatch repair proteins mutS family domain-containing protein n=1 Tax=Elizabethkingia bruuniana TaxID=1756149 RepID=A0A7T7V333_9FLAO|nr:hypothetical protein [Elizabethkingia bruuniana]KGO10648.1 hypothetical protein KS04_08290 [Elizabethkingia miricola]AQX87084.1 hypothetical protein AYC65_19625 [Elizabethkingia bruuniana]KUY26670.1 hypothetical protein ATB97_03965 [Elizabethkingia bruuniana]OPB66891.1 hypothetical protein BAY12_05190 [Elizabethkingia bruuniana]QDZ63808.1 hypothetical protein EVD20_16345 [Elizabethkingia bruuniana]